MMNAIRRIATGALALVGLSLLAAGTSWSAPSGAPIRIGCSMALTGPLATSAIVHQIVGQIYV